MGIFREKRQFFRVRRIQQSTASLKTSQLLLAGSLRSRRIIRQYCVSWDTAAPQFSNGLKKTRLFPGYRQRVALYSAYRQRVGDVSSVAAAKISVSARHAERAWLEP